jgi:hypothetical protein
MRPVSVSDSAILPTPDADDEDLGEDLGGLDDLLASLRSEDEPAPKRGLRVLQYKRVQSATQGRN